MEAHYPNSHNRCDYSTVTIYINYGSPQLIIYLYARNPSKLNFMSCMHKMEKLKEKTYELFKYLLDENKSGIQLLI